MKKILSFTGVLALAMSLQSCVAFVYGPGYGPGWHWYHRGPHPRVTTDASAQATPSINSDTALSEHYGISQHSAEMIADLAAGTNTSDVLKAAGVTEADLAPLKNEQMPSAQTIDTVAQNLGENSATISQIFSDFIADAKTSN